MAGIRAADGSLNVTVVSGSSLTGLYARDGSINVVLATGSSYVGAYHPCGAWYVTVRSSGGPYGYYAADGSMNVVESPYSVSGAVRVTAVSGDLTPGGGGGTAGTPIGLLLALTYAS